MLIMVGVCLKQLDVGYVIDFVEVFVLLLGEIVEKKICVISNVGGINLQVCVVVFVVVCEKVGVQLKIVVFYGDNL